MSSSSPSVPIIVLCYNNYKYVEFMIQQLRNILGAPEIMVFNNGSTDQLTISYLASLPYPVINSSNIGPFCWMQFSNLIPNLPSIYAVTDADLLFNPNMPPNFIDNLVSISNTYQSMRVGMALDISDYPLMYNYRFCEYGYNAVYEIWTSQRQFWTKQIPDPFYELYQSPIDTTFFVLNSSQNGPDIRVADNYTMKCLSWYPDISLITSSIDVSRLQRYLAHSDQNAYYPIGCFEKQYLADNSIIPVTKGSKTNIVKLNGTSDDDFWSSTYPTEYLQTFSYMDLYLSKDKDFIDIGAWIGDTSLYASYNSSRVIAVEPDPTQAPKLQDVYFLNRLECPFILETSALYSETVQDIYFCNLYNPGCISLTDPGTNIKINGISFSDLIAKYSISRISLINVNTNGSEQYFFRDVYNYSLENGVPLFVTFHYQFWKTNLDLSTSFPFLTESQISQIQAGTCSILFNAPA